MCLHHNDDDDDNNTNANTNTTSTGNAPQDHGELQPFPWHLAICDAHCHPTDTMDVAAAAIPSMRAAALTVMATRSQDQHLVEGLARHHPYPASPEKLEPGRACVVPAFGWHPWFSHQLYDDEAAKPTFCMPASAGAAAGAADPTLPGPSAVPPDASSAPGSDAALHAAKAAHYSTVLAPSSPTDSFVASLPTPVALSSLIAATEARLDEHPLALVGEVGIDKAFRLPQAWDASSAPDPELTPGSRDGRLLSPHRVRVEHQRVVLAAQLRLAARLRRPVSVHGVQAHGVLYQILSETWRGHERPVVSRRQRRLVAPHAEDSSDDEDKDEPQRPGENHSGAVSGAAPPYPPRICLHSFSGGTEMIKQYLHPSVPARIFVSLSTAVNLSTETTALRTDDVLRVLPEECILIESDLHKAGEPMDQALEDMYRRVCNVKGWELEAGVDRIARNYKQFIHG